MGASSGFFHTIPHASQTLDRNLIPPTPFDLGSVIGSGAIMIYVKNPLVFLVTVFALSACGPSEGKKENSYKISPEGAVETKNRNVYSSIGDVTFFMNQRYKITIMNDNEKKFHFLVVNVRQKVGNKNVEDEKGVLLPISDGSHIVDCQHYYDVKIGKEEDVSSPVCEFELIGTIYPDGKAKLHQSK